MNYNKAYIYLWFVFDLILKIYAFWAIQSQMGYLWVLFLVASYIFLSLMSTKALKYEKG